MPIFYIPYYLLSFIFLSFKSLVCNYFMTKICFPLPIYLSAFFTFVIYTQSAWIYYGVYESTIPSYTYPIDVNAGDVVTATLSWPNSQDLDSYIYRAGMDLLSRVTWLDREYSGSLNPEVLVYTIPSSGRYYVRADLYSSTPTAYTMEIKINGVSIGTYYDTVLTVTTGRTVQQFSTNNACKVRITYNGYVCPIYLFSPGASVTSGSGYAS